jgi:rare lipoprotein A
MKKIVSLALLAALVAGCANNNSGTYGYDGFGEEQLTTDGASLNDTYLTAAAPKYYIGSAYKVDNVQYVPSEDMHYNQTGVVGIIPAELNGTKTSNGEIFDMSQMVATSKTLPLPTIARITNLENGNNATVRINNRGPFVNTRIMDVSPAVAAKLGINGTAKVQIQVLADESMAVKNATLGGTTATPMTTVETDSPATQSSAPAAGDYAVQVAAFYSQDSADALAARMQTYGSASVVFEGDMYKVRINGLDAPGARGVIDQLRTNEGMAPGLLKSGKWVNADSI